MPDLKDHTPAPSSRSTSPAEAGPRALRRAFEIADLLARAPSGLSLAEISERIGAPKSSVLALLRALVGLNLATRADDRYEIGPALFNLAGAITAKWRIAPIARPFMQRLHALTGETVILAELNSFAREVQYIDQIESTNPVRYTVQIGDTRPLYCSAAGRLLLAFQTADWIEEYLASTPMTRITEQTITNTEEVRRKLVRVRQEGFSLSSEEFTDGGAGFAAPIIHRDGSVHYALVLATVAMRVRQKGEFFRSAVMDAAADLSRAMGHDGSTESGTD
ncbi:IclR family transcriptional regulator [Futiania mangrovi]|uniref:IclR family transcriptional regulator n=1 Tax=Futiania mangrovi TaxID=2959716 RepID=A0A9J6PEN1_9PROT|nr:IclR family transcriptional regulator [Futiania mangrovii]MCP1336288.1 IclR family transcriptional regulator [Futiania mangrovii]